MNRRPPRFTRTDPLFPNTTLFRSRYRTSRAFQENAWAEPRMSGGRSSSAIRPVMNLYSDPPFFSRWVCGETTTPSTLCGRLGRSEEHTSELQSLMRISYAVFCLTKKKYKTQIYKNTDT